MPICPSCGKNFSGFSIGPNPAVECADCRRAKAQAASASASPIVAGAPDQRLRRIAWRPVVTQTLVALNVLVYLAMVVSGVSWIDPSITDAIRWGADFGPLTLSGQWWRLLTSTFVHFGLIHIGFNMWCLWELGRSLEFLMGRKGFVVTYLVSGLAASMVSVAWSPWRVSAGASGAIFGVAGAFVSYLYFKKTPIHRKIVQQKLRSLGIFIAYNLFYGLRSGVDNSAHIGGLVAGLILGAVFPPMVRAITAAGPASAPIESDVSHDVERDRTALKVAFWSALVLLLGASRLYAVNRPAEQYGKAVSLFHSGHPDQGIDQMQQALKLNPTLLLGQALLGEWELNQGNARSAVPVLEQALTLAPNAYDLQHNLALAYLGSGRPNDAMEEITQAIKNEKDDAWPGYFILGVAAQGMGDLKMAAQNLQRVVQSKPDFYEAKNWLAFVDLQQNDANAARSLYAEVLKARPTDAVATAGISFLQANPQKSQTPPSQLAAIPLPYSILVMKSAAWPYYP